MPVPSELDWGALFARYQAMAIGFARGQVGDPEVAAELYQDAVASTYERAKTGGLVFESEAHARNYLFQALRHGISDWRAGRRRAPAALAQEPADHRQTGPLATVAGAELQRRRQQALARAWSRLPERERQALEFRYLRGLTYKEMAVATGRSISTLQARVDAGLRRLRERIGKPQGEE